MRITTLNLRGFVDWETRRPLIERYLGQQQPDVVVFQEVVFLPDVSPFTQPTILNRTLRYPFVHTDVTRLQAARDGGLYREGLSLVARRPVVTTETLVLRHQTYDPHQRIVQFADIDAGGGVTWRIANVHLSVRDDYAVTHLEEVLGVLAARGEARIIAGDFNVNHLERHRHLWQDEYVLSTEVEQYVSYPHSGQANDYVLLPRAYRFAAITPSSDDLSDHRALTVDIEPAEAAPVKGSPSDAA